MQSEMMGIEFVDNEMLKKIAECKNKPLHECPELFRVLAANCKCDTIKDLYDLCESRRRGGGELPGERRLERGGALGVREDKGAGAGGPPRGRRAARGRGRKSVKRNPGVGC